MTNLLGVMRGATASVWVLVTACVPSARVESPAVAIAPWEGRLAYCVVGRDEDEAEEIARLVTESLDAWRVEAPVEVGTVANLPVGWPCVPVAVTDDVWDGRMVGVTRLGRQGPAWVVFARWYWERCPEAREALVLHEIGHSVGHIGHSSDGYAMAESVTCGGVVRVAPSEEEIGVADEVRRFGITL